MSQEKVNRYKEYKAHRKEILAKEKRKKLIARITGWTLLALVVVGIAGGIGWNVWSKYQAELAARPTYQASAMLISDLTGMLDEETEAAE